MWVCFLWALVWCRGFCICLSFFLPPFCLSLSLSHSRSLMCFHSLSILCQPPLARARMSILSDVPCTNHPHTDSTQRRRLAKLMHVECKCLCVCHGLARACSLVSIGYGYNQNLVSTTKLKSNNWRLAEPQYDVWKSVNGLQTEHFETQRIKKKHALQML